MTNLRNMLIKLMDNKGFKVPELAKNSGVPSTTIYSILDGRTEQPRKSTVSALEKALEAPLTSDSHSERMRTHDFSTSDDAKIRLFKEISIVIHDISNKFNLTLTDDDKSYFAQEIYLDSIEKSMKSNIPPSVDKIFAELLMRH